MKRTVVLNLILLVLLSGMAAANTDVPEWVNDLRLYANKTLQTKVDLSTAHMPDRPQEGKYFIFLLKGEGSLEKVPDPFAAIEHMFITKGWKYVAEYQADGHGGSSFAYEHEKSFCNIHMHIDSSCDDEETGHVPSMFWFDIYCREK